MVKHIPEEKEVEKLRKEINKVDRVISVMLKKRFSLVKRIGYLKKKNSMNIIDLNREKKVIDRAVKIAGKYKKEIEEVFKKIIMISRNAER
jgi:chorismate mutase